MGVLSGHLAGQSRPSKFPEDNSSAAVEQIRHMHDSPSQILALAFRINLPSCSLFAQERHLDMSLFDRNRPRSLWDLQTTRDNPGNQMHSQLLDYFGKHSTSICQQPAQRVRTWPIADFWRVSWAMIQWLTYKSGCLGSLVWDASSIDKGTLWVDKWPFKLTYELTFSSLS